MFSVVNINHSYLYKKITFVLQFMYMKISYFLVLFFLINISSHAQENLIHFKKDIAKKVKNDSIPLDSIRNLYGARYVDYKIIKHNLDTIQIDTVLGINKHFSHNFTEKDIFEYVEQSNQGQALQKLAYQFVDNKLLPSFGIRGKRDLFYNIEDIDYYHVPTPTTILKYRSGLEGQFLNAIFTTNFSKFNNFSIAYKGLSSLGDYANQQARSTHFRTTYSYFNPQKRYQFKVHIANQKRENQENGGLTVQSIQEFKDDNPDFSTRSRIDVNLPDASSTLKSDRYYFEHAYRLRKTNDSVKTIKNNLTIGHKVHYTIETYDFNATNVSYFNNNAIYGDQFTGDLNDRGDFSVFNNQFYAQFDSPYLLGNFTVFHNYYTTKQTYKTLAFINGNIIPNRRKEQYNSIGANWKAKVKGVFLNADAEQIFTGDQLGTNLNINAGFVLKKNIKATAGILIKDKPVNANFNFFQSKVKNFNWNNNFDNETISTLYGHIKTPWLNAEGSINNIDNYAYFDQNSLASQFNDNINYIRLKLSNEFVYKKFHLNNEVLLQNVVKGKSILRVPKFTTRNTFYYSSYFFKGKPLEAQIGIEFKYFSKYFANEFNPVLNEFYLQNNTIIGDYPKFDFFINGKIRRTRIYFKVENFTDQFTGRNYFAIPSQPIKDLTIRFGLVWNFFN